MNLGGDKSLGFWSKMNVQSEQPKVTFMNNVYAEFMFTDPVTPSVAQMYAYSTVKSIRDQAAIS
jgi:hypothetical protein